VLASLLQPAAKIPTMAIVIRIAINFFICF
jgi:hypothetical protein